MSDWGELKPPREPLPQFDTYLELWDYCFDGFRNLLPEQTRETFVAVSQAYTEEIVRIAKSQKAMDDSVVNYWPDEIHE